MTLELGILHSNQLKIDQTFVRAMLSDSSAAAIVKSIISLAHNLNLKVIAEGVENKEQLEFLNTLNCDEAQGYYVGKPMIGRDFRKYIYKVNQLYNRTNIAKNIEI
jgi:EAL domain-containing protein (putative c-di-GMP-specific phosphodiesterase class I)